MEANVKTHRLLLATFALGGAFAALPATGCKYDLPVDNPNDNPGISPPAGIVQGNASYYGPGPCVRNGQLEGALVILVFNFLNPPPPDGLATTAVTFATVPAEKLFEGLARPTDPKVPGGGDIEYCPPLDSTPIAASSQYTVSQLSAGHYQIRAFFSRQNKFFPLFDFEELPLSGDTQGGAVVDPTAAKPSFIHVRVGVSLDPSQDPNDPATVLKMPESGFFLGGVPVVVGQTLKTSRPYFHVDYAGSRGFARNPDNETAKDPATAWPSDGKNPDGTINADGSHAASGYDDPVTGDVAGIVMTQDHPITSNQHCIGTSPACGGKICLANPDPSCDIFQYAETSLPSVHFRYGFPGSFQNCPGGSCDITAADMFGETSPEAWMAKLALPSVAAVSGPRFPFYGVDPNATELAPGAPLPEEAQKFQLTRNFNPDGTPAILVDNNDLKTLGLIADLFPQVVLAKLAQVSPDPNSDLVQPIQPQSDPIVVIQGFTLRGNHMKATSEGDIAGGALAKAGGDPSQTNPLHFKGGEELTSDFTALLRPAALCISPHDPNLRGTLVAPYELDPNPNNPNKPAFLVTRDNILAANAARVKAIEFGCIPPGIYAINLVYPTGQAWTTPGLLGECSFTVTGKPDENCMQQIVTDVGAAQPFVSKGFDLRPFLHSQMLWDTDSDASQLLKDGTPKKPMVIKVTASARCMDLGSTPIINHDVQEDANHNGVLDIGEDQNGDGILQMRVPDACMVLLPPGSACVGNSQCITSTCNNKVCTSRNVGDDCTRDEQCASLTCDGGTSKCAKARVGIPCSTNDFCASNKCVNSVCQ
jgi:hypothetical protein